MATSLGDGDKTLEEKKILVTEKLSKREEERQDNALKRREEKEKGAAADESTQHFVVNFARMTNAVDSDLSRSMSIPKPELSAHFDKISVGFLNLQKALADATIYLPVYEVRHAQDIIYRLALEIQTQRDDILPKKKFAFKSKKKTTDKTDGPQSVNSKGKESAENEKKDMSLELADCKFVDRQGETLEMSGDDIKLKDVALARLSECKVFLRGSPSAVHIRGLKDCQVFCGPVGGSIFITDCVDCVFVMPCQQLRIHTTTGTKFYIHVTSRAIIEDSTRVEFAPYNWNYEGLDEHYSISGLDKDRNNWDNIDDFNWLASDKHSPNWSLINEEERVKAWNM